MRASILMLGLVVGEVAAGCGFHSSSGAAVDGGADGTDGNGGCTSFAALVNTCQLSFDADLPVTGSASYDTDTHVLMIGGTVMPVALKTVMIGADPVDVLSARDVHLGVSSHLRATGSHGLAIIASSEFLIDADAQIDVSNGGAGARTACPNGATTGKDDKNGAGGGGGGGFGADGGKGGDGNHDGPPAPGGSQGKAETSFPLGFHGGCPGADGGTGDVAGGAGGKGGGALYIVAAGRMVFSSTAPLTAGGGGGVGGGHNGGTNGNGDAGGGGGGSGGLLYLESPHIMAATASIAANGGAGGEGSDRNGAGVPGANANVSVFRASGGSGGAAKGSDGGDGGSSMGPTADSVTDNADGGGGGGGGGVGFIRVRSSDAMVLAISPTPG
jgi:hypothetical protein